MIHEQYYYPDFCAYIKDFAPIVEETVRYLTEKGRKPVWLEEIAEKYQQNLV
jgi:hypothetical protein